MKSLRCYEHSHGRLFPPFLPPRNMKNSIYFSLSAIFVPVILIAHAIRPFSLTPRAPNYSHAIVIVRRLKLIETFIKFSPSKKLEFFMFISEFFFDIDILRCE